MGTLSKSAKFLNANRRNYDPVSSMLSRRNLITVAGATGIHGFAIADDVSEIVETRYYTTGPFGHIHVREAGPRTKSKLPPLVCFHQSPVSGAQYLLFQRVMAKSRRVLCPDTPGFGSSDPPPFVPSIADYSKALAGSLESLGFDSNTPVDVLGFHTGTLVAVEMAATRTDLVRKVVLSSLALFTSEELARNRAGFGGPRPLFEDPDYIKRYFEQQVTNGLSGMSPDRRFELFVERLRSGALSWYGPEAVFNYDTAGQAAKIAQPTLLLVLKDTLSENTRRAKAVIPNSIVVERQDIHGPAGWDSHPNEIAGEVRRFLDSP